MDGSVLFAIQPPCRLAVRWRARYIAMNRSKSRFKIDYKKIMDRISKFRPDHDMALMGIGDHCSFRSVRWSARGGVAKSRRKSLKIHRHTDTQTNWIIYIDLLILECSLGGPSSKTLIAVCVCVCVCVCVYLSADISLNCTKNDSTDYPEILWVCWVWRCHECIKFWLRTN